MKLGFIGTGKITSAVVTGICKSKIKYTKIILSERNKKISKQIKKSFKKIYIAKNNHCLLYTSPSPRAKRQSRMPSSA